MNASGAGSDGHGWAVGRGDGCAAGLGSAGIRQGSRSRGEPPRNRFYSEVGAKVALCQLVVCLPAELPEIRGMYSALLFDGYTLSEAAAFILSAYDVREPQIRADQEERRTHRYELIRNPETRRTVIPENVSEAEHIAAWDEIDRMLRETDASLIGLSVDDINARTEAMFRDFCDGGGFGGKMPSSDPEIAALQAKAALFRARARESDAKAARIRAGIGGSDSVPLVPATMSVTEIPGEQILPQVVSLPVEPSEVHGKKKVQSPGAVVMVPALPPPRATGLLAKLRSLFS